ncbi:glycosyltransferase family 2 protein [bacterium]|nr:glycosyltransferase family 2 protein [bacterium]
MLSIVIITNNEEQNIGKCLEHLSWCKDIVVVDSGSTDDTVNIAKKYTDKVFFREFDNFSSQRNFGIKQTSNDWVLSLDPDEEVKLDLKEEILDVIKKDRYSAYYIPFRHHFFGKWLRYGGWYPSYLKRLFRKDKAYWDNDVHEILQAQGAVGYLKNPIWHYSHRDVFMFISKMNKYTNIEAEMLAKKGKKDTFFTIVFHSCKTFFNRYFLQRGFLDGMHGFVVAVLLGFYVFVYRVKNWENSYKKRTNWSF